MIANKGEQLTVWLCHYGAALAKCWITVACSETTNGSSCITADQTCFYQHHRWSGSWLNVLPEERETDGDVLRLTGSIQRYFQHKGWIDVCVITSTVAYLQLRAALSRWSSAVHWWCSETAGHCGSWCYRDRSQSSLSIPPASAPDRSALSVPEMYKNSRQTRGAQFGWAQITFMKTAAALTHTCVQTHTHSRTHAWKPSCGGPITQLSHRGSQQKSHPFWARLHLKAANIPAAALSHGWGKFLQTNPLTVSPASAQNNILRAFTGAPWKKPQGPLSRC